MKINAGGIEIELTRKNIKNINLSVRPDGSVRVSAPYHVPTERIEKFVASKYDWIISHLEDIPKREESTLARGERIFVFGKEYALCYSGESSKGAYVLGNELVLPINESAPYEMREAAVEDFFRRELALEISYLMPIWQERTGLVASKWNIVKMKTRWGSCNSKSRSIHFALELAKKPPECIEYVILHELAHLREANHSERFKAILDEYMPNWRSLKQKLNRI